MQHLVEILGAVALLFWGVRLVRQGLERACAKQLKRTFYHIGNKPLLSLGAGTGLAAALQSSTAVVTMTAGFAARGHFGLIAGLALALGADIGTGLAAQFLNLDISHISPGFFCLSMLLVLLVHKKVAYNIARAFLGFGLIFLALKLISAAGVPLRESQVVHEIFDGLAKDFPMAMLIGAVLAVLASSSLAIVLLVAQLAAEQVIPFPLGVALMLGVNLSAGIPALIMTHSEEVAGRRIVIGNLWFRVIGVLLSAAWINPAASLFAGMDMAGGQGIVVLHLLFNIALALVFLPLLPLAARTLQRLLPENTSESDEDKSKPVYLQESDKDHPERALSNVVREILRMAEIVHEMLIDSFTAFTDKGYVARIKQRDDKVDAIHRSAVLYLADVTREYMSKEQSRRAMEIFSFSSNLEHIGDIVDHNLMELAQDQHKISESFSDDGGEELRVLHNQLLDNFRLALDVFITEDEKLAKRLLKRKQQFRDLVHQSSERHLERLREGCPSATATTAIHLDILHDYYRMNSHLSAAAYPVLDTQTDDAVEAPAEVAFE